MATAAALSVRISANTSEFTKEISSLERSMNKLGSGLQSAGAKLTTGITLPIVAIGGAAIKAAMDFETAFSGVAKTVDGVANSKGQLTAFGKELQQGFRDAAKTIPVTVNELAKIGQVAGAMGIPTDKILQFSVVMAKLAQTTDDLTSDQASASIGKIQAVFRSAGVDTDRFANSLVALGNAGNSTEGQILAFAERMGGAAVQASVSQAEVLGWANAMASVGLNAELGSTAWNKVISNIGVAVDLGSSKLQGFAAVAGMSADAFSKMFKADASEALNRVVEGFGRVKDSGGNLTQVMVDLGMKTSGIQMTFKNLASAGDMVRASLELGKKAWQDNAAMEDEFAKKSATTASILKVLFNRLYDVGISLGQQLIPAFMRLLPAIESVLGVLVRGVDLFSKLPANVQTSAIAFFALAAALGPVVFAVGTLISTGSGLVSVFRMFTVSTTGAAGGIASLGLSTGGTIVGLTALAGVLGLVTVKVSESIREIGFWKTAAQGMSGALSALSPTLAAAVFGGGPSSRGRAPAQVEATSDPLTQFIKQTEDAQKFMRDAQALRPDLFPGAGAPMKIPGFGDGESAKRTRELEAEKKAWKAFMDTISGRDAIKDAEKWIRGVTELGGVTKLTGANQERMNRVLIEAMSAYKALGLSIPLDVMREFTAIQTPAFITSVSQLSDQTLAEAAKMAELRALMAGQAPQMIMPEMPTAMSAETLASRPSFPSLLQSMFGSARDFGSMLGQALTGGGNVANNVGELLGGSIVGKLGSSLVKKLGEKGFSGLIGGALGSALGPLGSMVGGLIGKGLGKVGGFFGKLFGFDGEKKKTNELRDQFIEQAGGLNELKKVADEAGFSLDKLLSTKKVKDFEAEVGKLNDAMEAHKAKLKAIGDIIEGVNARAKNITSQIDLDVVGAGAFAAFTLQIKEGSSAVEAFNNIAPAITAMRDAMAGGNLVLTESAARLLNIGLILDQNKIQFENLGASGQILQAMLQGGIRDATLFAAVSMDIGAQIQTVIDRGVPMAQVFALAQPQLQALWEAQQKWGFAVDETTAGLLSEAEAQGFVGVAMQSVNQQILSVLVAIGDVLGAQIPAALRGLPAHAQAAADGMNAAFSSVTGPNILVPTGEYLDNTEVPQMATGGIVRARNGGTLVNVGEGGHDEAIVPLRQSPVRAGAQGGTAIVEMDGRTLVQVLVPLLPGEVRRYGLA